MTAEERQALIDEQNAITEQNRVSPFVSPKSIRRLNEITSLLLTDGATDGMRFEFGKPRKSKRVTSFSRHRR